MQTPRAMHEDAMPPGARCAPPHWGRGLWPPIPHNQFKEKEPPMADAVQTPPAGHPVPGSTLSRTMRTGGVHLMRYGLVLVVAWIGAMKFTAYEANGIQPLVANSPVMGWVYHVCSIQAFSNVLGVVELAIALMIALRPLSAAMAAVGSAAA